MPKKAKPKTLADVYEDLEDLARVLSYESPQITDKDIAKRLGADIKVLNRVTNLIDQLHLKEIAQELKFIVQIRKARGITWVCNKCSIAYPQLHKGDKCPKCGDLLAEAHKITFKKSK